MDQVRLAGLLQTLYRRLLPPELHPGRVAEEQYLPYQPGERRLPDEEVRGALVVSYLLHGPESGLHFSRSRLFARPGPRLARWRRARLRGGLHLQ